MGCPGRPLFLGLPSGLWCFLLGYPWRRHLALPLFDESGSGLTIRLSPMSVELPRQPWCLDGPVIHPRLFTRGLLSRFFSSPMTFVVLLTLQVSVSFLGPYPRGWLASSSSAVLMGHVPHSAAPHPVHGSGSRGSFFWYRWRFPDRVLATAVSQGDNSVGLAGLAMSVASLDCGFGFSGWGSRNP